MNTQPTAYSQSTVNTLSTNALPSADTFPAKAAPPRLRALVLLACALGTLSLTGCGVTSHGRNMEGVRMFQQGYYQGALQKFQDALYSDTNNPDSYYNLAATYHRMAQLPGAKAEDKDQAERYYNQALDRDPNHRDAYRGLAVLLAEQDRSKEAFRLLEGWVQRNPTLSNARIELARLHDEFGDRLAAKDQLLESLALEPYNSRALAALGRIHEQMGNTQQALVDYQRSLWHDRFQPEVSARVAALQSTLGGGTRPPGSAPDTRTVTTPPPVTR